MPGLDPTRQIWLNSQAGGKRYAFAEQHDSTKPAQMWFQKSSEGLVLFIVFYTQACRWSRCIGCNLPSKSSQFHIDYEALFKQIDYVFSDPAVLQRRFEIKKVIISNNGSVFDEQTFSSTALMYLVGMLNIFLPNLAVLTVETRPEYVDVAELEILSRAIREGKTPTELEIAIGFEAFDEHVRNTVFQKGLSLNAFQTLVAEMAPYGYRLKCYFMQKPVPDMSDDAATADIRQAIDYLDAVSKQYGVTINMHLNPTYVASGTTLEQSFLSGQYAPPKLIDVARAALHARGTKVSVYIGLFDEGLAVDGGSFIRPGDDKLVSQLERFNTTHDFGILQALVA